MEQHDDEYDKEHSDHRSLLLKRRARLRLLPGHEGRDRIAPELLGRGLGSLSVLGSRDGLCELGDLRGLDRLDETVELADLLLEPLSLGCLGFFGFLGH